MLIIFSLNTLAFVHRSLDFRGILKNQNLLGFEVLISFPDTKSPAVPTHWAFGSTGNEGFRVVFKFCSAPSPWYHLEPLTWPLCTSIILLIRGNNDQGETELQCVRWQGTSGSIEKWGAPVLYCLFLSNTFFALFLSLLKQLYLSSWFFPFFSYCEFNCPYRNNNFLKPFSLCLLCGKSTAASSSSRTYNEQYFQFNVISRKVLINERQNFLLLKTKFYFYFKPDGSFLCLIWLLCAGLLNLESDLYKTY